jgi:hypothetical protein
MYDASQTAIEPIVTIHDPIAEGTAETLGDPVLAADGSVAFHATYKPARGAVCASLFWATSNGTISEVARRGAAAVDVANATWSGFSSFAITAARGPLFIATLGGAGHGTKGVWAMDSTHRLSEAFRIGDMIEGRPLRGFTLLNALAGSPGVTRSFNDHGQIVWRASFPQNEEAIVVTTVP